LVIVVSKDANREIDDKASFNIKGFSRMIANEREVMLRLGELLERQQNIEMEIRTVREDFPYLFEDQKVVTK
jgi:sialic acid synthase SpsE